MKISLESHTALVTGAGSGIGRAIATAFARSGASVIVLDLNSDAATAVADDLKTQGYAAYAIRADVGLADEVNDAIALATKEFRAPDILVNNAGFTRDRSLTKMTHEDWSAVRQVILDGAFNCTKAVVPNMRELGWGRLINISSRAYLGNPGQANYSAAKAGLIGLTRSNALEFGKFGITANCIAPGLIDTPLVRGMPNFDDMAARFAANTPIRRIGVPEDVAAAAVFLASDRAGYITGDTLHVTGGRYG